MPVHTRQIGHALEAIGADDTTPPSPPTAVITAPDRVRGKLRPGPKAASPRARRWRREFDAASAAASAIGVGGWPTRDKLLPRRPYTHYVSIMADPITETASLNERTRAIFRSIVESYLATGEPVGSRNLSRVLPTTLSPASIRNVMSDLEHLGLIDAPHTSAGRLPTQIRAAPVRRWSAGSRRALARGAQGHRGADQGRSRALGRAGAERSRRDDLRPLALRRRRLAEKEVSRLKHIEFVALEPGRALVVLVGEENRVENRVISVPPGLPPSSLIEAANYLNAHIRGSASRRHRIDRGASSRSAARSSTV